LTDGPQAPFTFYEFFAGGGMARVGLGNSWSCAFANDNSLVKAAAYRARWGEGELDERDIDEVRAKDLPHGAHLAWASFPCQDLSVAGAGRGVGSADDRATRSSALWPFIELMADLKLEARHPAVIALENVPGLLSSNGGRDFAAVCEALAKLGYVFGAVIVDAKHFVAQSRPRVFVIAARDDLPTAPELCVHSPVRAWHSPALAAARAQLSAVASERWRWWTLGEPPVPPADSLAKALDLSEAANWNTEAETSRLLAMMLPLHKARLDAAASAGRPVIGSLYLRMRPRRDGGGNVQCAEIAFGHTLGCLRTPRGGASRPRIVVVNGNEVRTRLLSPREAATLMGLPADHPLPERYQHAFQLVGDGVVVPVVAFLARTIIEPILAGVGRPNHPSRIAGGALQGSPA
jgi:DNA (cytosine-5)-methyltransferase 1